MNICSKMKILIVDDDAPSREFMSAILDKCENLNIASSGKEAVNMIMAAINVKKPYDLILLDISMPNMCGIEVLTILRSAERLANLENYTNVIMTTGLEDEKTILKAFKSGCDAYLLKPIIVVELIDKIENIMGIK